MKISAFNPCKDQKISTFLFIALSVLLPFQLSAQAVSAINTDSEKRWAEQLEDNIVTGDPLYLPSGSDKNSKKKEQDAFFTIYTPENTEKALGAVILIHGTGAHPDWGDVIHPLRVELPDTGWATLSIQMPLTFADKKDAQSRKEVIEAALPRIKIAIDFLRQESYQKVVIIAHSFGTLMTLDFLQKNSAATLNDGSPLVNAAIIIGTPSQGEKIPLNSPAMIEKIHIPLLDLYGSNDLDSVMKSAKARKNAANKAGNKNYRQSETLGANHFYQGLDEELVNYVRSWLKKTLKTQP